MSDTTRTPNNLWDLPDSVLQSEFPEIWRQKQQTNNNYDVEQIFIDKDNDEVYLKRRNSKNAERINLTKVSDLLKYPKMPELRQLDEQKIIRDWVSLADDNIYDRTNANWETIRSDFSDLWFNLQAIQIWAKQVTNFLKIAVEQNDTNLSTALSENYYPKTEVNQKLNLLEAKINNLQKRVQAAPAIGPYANPSRTDQYPTNINVNDDVLDEETKKTIDNWNQE